MVEITTELIQKLVDSQFPEWTDLPVYPVKNQGNDNRTFHLGDSLLVRLPSAIGYAPQVAREQRWLAFLADRLPLPIPVPLALGHASEDFPFPWSVNRYLEGENARVDNIASMADFAHDLGNFLRQLQAIDATDGPVAGAENCFRGADLTDYVYQEETYQALSDLTDELPAGKLRTLWDEAVSQAWDRPPVWLHGDIAPSNLLVKNGQLAAVIDFGIMAVGDPACDLAIAWTFFDKKTREILFAELAADKSTIRRGRAWALWKALITYHSAEKWREIEAHYVVREILAEI